MGAFDYTAASGAPFSTAVQTPGELAALATATVPQGGMAYVDSLKALFTLDKGSSASPDNVSVIAASGGGNWVCNGGATDGSGNEKVHEQFAPAYEDNANGVAGTLALPVIGSTYAPTPYWAANTHDNIVKASAGNLLGFHVINRNVAVRYLLVVNSSSGGTSPIICAFEILASSFITIGRDELTEAGIYCSSGITLLLSSSNTAYSGTGVNDSDHDCTAFYK